MTKTLRPCHLHGMFIRHDGYIFPCCRLWGNEKFIIGHISDPHIIDKINNYDTKCSCVGFIFSKSIDSKLSVNTINIEFPMICNGRCAMCCVGAPFKQKSDKGYDYDSLYYFVRNVGPKLIAVQGGEVLVQSKTLEWISGIKNEFKNIMFHVITNGCVHSRLANLCALLFNSMTISIVGFQDQTYKSVMGLDIPRMKKFALNMINSRETKVSLKYLVTPLNLHEISLFFKWAVDCCPDSIQIVDSSFESYININTKIPFWPQIVQRSANELVNMLFLSKNVLNSNNIAVLIDDKILNSFCIRYSDLKRNGFHTVKPYC